MKKVAPIEVTIPIQDAELKGTLCRVDDNGEGLVIFAHGSGSSRRSPRNLFVADRMHQAGISTLLFDLLTEEEERLDERTRHLRFDIPMLANRLQLVTRWAMQRPRTRELAIGYFGASTGAAAALVAAATFGDQINAVVSRGGRPDLAGQALHKVTAPTLLIVGGEDEQVTLLNHEAMAQMQDGMAELEVVPGATHLFEEPGALERVADLAGAWFAQHFLGYRHVGKNKSPSVNTQLDA